MKKTTILCSFLLAFSMLFTACNSCSKPTPEPEPEFTGYNFDEVIINDYDYIASQYEHFEMYEADARFDSALSIECENKINYVKTTFQCEDTVNMILHTPDTATLNSFIAFAETISTWKTWTIDTNDTDYRMHLIFEDLVIECGDFEARNPITFDSCMKIVEPYREQLNTRALTLRRFISPGTPDNAQYVFGTGTIIVDVVTGEVGTLD